VMPRSSTAYGPPSSAPRVPAAAAGGLAPVSPVAAMVGLSLGYGHGCAAHVVVCIGGDGIGRHHLLAWVRARDAWARRDRLAA
jgi:hypothetical protein